MTTQEEIDARFRAIAPDPTLKLDDKFLVTRALMQEVKMLKAENARLQAQYERDALRMKCLEAEMDMDSHAVAMRAYEAALDALGQGE